MRHLSTGIVIGLLFLHGMPVAANAQEREVKIADLRERVVPVRSIAPVDDDFSDLAPIAAAIGNARIVQLGETTHGDGAAFAAKVRLVKFLHQHHGFDVLLWESGMYDVRVVNDSIRAGADPVASAKLGIYGNWSHSAEVLPLFEYVGASHRGDRPLDMAGFDMQFSAPGVGDDARALERGLLRFVGGIDDDAVRDTATVLARGVSEGFRRLYAVAIAQTEFQRALREAGVTDAGRDSLRAWRQTRQASFAPSAQDLDRFLAATDGLLHILQQRQSALAGTRAELEVEFMARVVGNLRDYGLNMYVLSRAALTAAEYNPTENRRDARMADNIGWLAERMYPDRKLIVWAHNGHILNAHYGPDFTGPTSRPVDGGLKRMGAYVAERFGQAVYTVAFIAFTGEYGSARTGNRNPIGTMPAEGIEAMLHELGHSYAFLDFRRLPSGHWLRQPATMATLNYRPETSDDWTRIFDGVFFIDRMTAARPIQQQGDSLTVEVLAAGHLLNKHPHRQVQLDSAFALSGHAPGSPTAGLRPANRNRLLADSLEARLSREQPLGTARLTLSEPEFAGDSAMVTVTVSYDTGRRPSGRFYETVLVFLRRAGSAWRVERSEQLGIT
ncbi:MAG TPA: erythromycin esterase family protein [Gammaproteobacteria bacterium]|nr:erythromycin esterase family protein [Gammaproteobacteria bacterium]